MACNERAWSADGIVTASTQHRTLGSQAGENLEVPSASSAGWLQKRVACNERAWCAKEIADLLNTASIAVFSE